MNDKPSDQWQRDAQEHVAALELALSKFKGDAGAIAYRIVALAFPSAMPHPKSFDYALIDDKRFVMWATERGWKVVVEELGRAEASLQGELTAHGQVVAERDRLIGRIQGLEEIVKRIEQRPAKRAGRQAPLPLDESPQAD